MLSIREYYETTLWGTPVKDDEDGFALEVEIEEGDRAAAAGLKADDLVRLNLLNHSHGVVVGRVSKPLKDGVLTINDADFVETEFEFMVHPSLLTHAGEDDAGNDVLAMRLPNEEAWEKFEGLLQKYLYFPARLHDDAGRTIAYGNFVSIMNRAGPIPPDPDNPPARDCASFVCSGLMIGFEEAT